jgi:general secretion pathway protein K
MWVFMTLGVIALDFARYMRDDAMSAVNMADETRGYYIALAGLNRAMFDRERKVEGQAERKGIGTRQGAPGQDEDEDTEELVPPDGQWHEADFAGGRWAARMSDQESRIPLNMIKPSNPQHVALLRRVITNLVRGGNRTSGVDRREQAAVDVIVDSILDWRDRDGKKDQARPNGAESAFYLKRRIPYRAKNSFFDSPEELLLVRGVTPALFYGSDGRPGLRDVFSPYVMPSDEHQEPRINLLYTTSAVLQALLGVDAEEADQMLAKRQEGTSLEFDVKAKLTTEAPELLNYVGDYEPRVVMIEARGDVSAQRNQSRVAALVRLEERDGGGVTVMRWLDRAPWDAPLPGMPSEDEPT